MHQRIPVAFCLWDSVSILATPAVACPDPEHPSEIV